MATNNSLYDERTLRLECLRLVAMVAGALKFDKASIVPLADQFFIFATKETKRENIDREAA